MTKESFYNFLDVTKEQWVEQVKKDLKGKDFKQTLINKVWNNVELLPFYCSEDIPNSIPAFRFHGEAKLPGISPRIWNNAVSFYPIDDKDCNKEILSVLQQGADAIIIHLRGTENLHEVLKGVMTEFIQLYFVPLSSPRIIFNQIMDWIESLHVKPGMLQGAIIWSPTSDLIKRNGDFQENIKLGVEMIKKLSAFRDFYPMTLDFSIYEDSGANGIQQSFLGLAEMVEMMDAFIKEAVSTAMLFENMAVFCSVGELFFPEIAKLKAIRILLQELAFNLGQEISSSSFHFIISSSTWSKSLIDQNSNLIRQTYEAMSAIFGGADTLWVRPALGEKASELEKRMARNVSNILKEESYLDKVMDPAAGSYYIDTLVENLRAKILEELWDFEENGGWLENFESRQIQEIVRKERSSIQESYLTHEKIKVGANKYEEKGGGAEKISFEKIVEESHELKPTRATYLLEKKTLNQS
ncbi:hypothetical protein JYB62_09920 [Algoriphagus lutimaris]|uniref:methylmalonyl-CoA mutase family protein n=1 Tax=Algoriphagus lutimaris TaxID=613197 RepID=UPI00196B8D60|nr:methylmalonyl-CoA mutase family protein [Algoriphagus lutimaris]MBN3520320.1 hypothetical protein [Algoriphagus lutimaris]